MLDDTVSVPAAPGVPESRERLEVPSLLVTTVAVTPMPAVLIAPASPESVLSEESRVTTLAVPLPTWIEMERESLSPALVIDVSVPVEFCFPVPATPE